MAAPNTRNSLLRARSWILALVLGFAAVAPVHADPAPPPSTARPKKVQLTPQSTPEVTADGNLVVWRRVSAWEAGRIAKLKKLFLPPGTGESFVSTSREYVDQLAERHPKAYERTIRIELAPEAWAALVAIGRRAPDPALKKLFPAMREMSKDQPGAIHFKAELGVVNLGMREGSIETFNGFIRKIAQVPSTKAEPEAARDEKTKDEKTTGKPADADGLPAPAPANATTAAASANRPTLADVEKLSLGELMLRARRALGRDDVPETRPELMALLTGESAATVKARLEAAHGAATNLHGTLGPGEEEARLGIDDAIKGRVVEGIR